MIATRDFQLFDWQLGAVDAWFTGDSEPCTGTLGIFTGGGKTLIALEAVRRASARASDLGIAVVVPTEALAHQWRASTLEHTDIPESEVGLLGAGGGDDNDDDDLTEKRFLVAVLNTAEEHSPAVVCAQAERRPNVRQRSLRVLWVRCQRWS